QLLRARRERPRRGRAAEQRDEIAPSNGDRHVDLPSEGSLVKRTISHRKRAVFTRPSTAGSRCVCWLGGKVTAPKNTAEASCSRRRFAARHPSFRMMGYPDSRAHIDTISNRFAPHAQIGNQFIDRLDLIDFCASGTLVPLWAQWLLTLHPSPMLRKH